MASGTGSLTFLSGCSVAVELEAASSGAVPVTAASSTCAVAGVAGAIIAGSSRNAHQTAGVATSSTAASVHSGQLRFLPWSLIKRCMPAQSPSLKAN